MDWFILGIEPTKDKKVITDAYRQKLRQTNPEDKPEEFKALRAAYEEALTLADRAEDARDESPVGLWLEELQKLYDHFPSRQDPALWRELMARDVCIGLGTRPAAEEALLKFLMENFYLPRAVWQVLDETFGFSGRVEELYEAWPKEFIDHGLLGGIRFEPALDPALFTPGLNGKDCDTYRRLYFEASSAQPKDVAPILDRMEALSESHPYGQALRYRLWIHTGREQEGKEGYRKLAAAYPDNGDLTMAWAEIAFADGNIAEAEEIAARIMALVPQNLSAQTVYAKCLAAKGQYHEAKEYAYEIIKVCGNEPMLMEHITQQLRLWNEKLIDQREATYKENPGDIDNVIELAWCYAQNDRVEDALALADRIDPNYEDGFAYHNLLAKLYHNTGKFKEAIPHLQAVVDILRHTEDDGTEKTRKRLARLPEMLQVMGNCLLKQGRAAEAKDKFEEALAIAPEDEEVLSVMGKILYTTGDYAYAAEIFRRQLQLNPASWVAELLLATCLYRMYQDREAFDAVNRALALQTSDLSLYTLKMQILIRNEIYEDVHEILDFLKQSGAPVDIATEFIQAELTELEKKDGKRALRQYQAIEKRVEAGEDLVWTPELYYHMAVLTGNQLDVTREENRKTVLALLDKGLLVNSKDRDLLTYKAWVLNQGGLRDDAIGMYRIMLEKDPGSTVALRGIADLYYEDLSRWAGEALTYYEKLLETQKTAELYFYAATCKRHLGDWEGARVYYLKELEMDPEDIDGFKGLAILSDTRGNYAESLAQLDRALAIMEEYKRPYDWIVEHKAKVLRRLGRFEEALAFAADAAKRFAYSDGWQLQFDICCQAGWWDKAKRILTVWKGLNPHDPKQMVAASRLHLLQGKLFKAAMAMGPAKRRLPFAQVQDFRLQLAEMEQNYARQAELLTQRVQADPNDDHALTLLALACWHLGRKDAAKGAAERALKLLDGTLTLYLTDEPLYRGRRSLMLAILGDAQEAKAELAQTRALPLCEFCEYGSCKDADIYEAQIEEILGNYDKAQDLYAAGNTKWPDDLDFISGQLRLKKKGRK